MLPSCMFPPGIDVVCRPELSDATKPKNQPNEVSTNRTLSKSTNAPVKFGGIDDSLEEGVYGDMTMDGVVDGDDLIVVSLILRA